MAETSSKNGSLTGNIVTGVVSGLTVGAVLLVGSAFMRPKQADAPPMPPPSVASNPLAGRAGQMSAPPLTPDGQAVIGDAPAPGGAPSSPAGAAPATGAAQAMPPIAGMGGDPSAPLTATPDKDKAIADLEAGDGGDKKKLAEAYADRGYSRMTDDAAGPRVKYRAALDDFRKALQFDPLNAKAKTNKEMIEKIYRDMGRPIPGEEGAKTS